MTKALQENAEQFFDRVYEKHKQSMTCSIGCSQCCYTDISIFTWEAELILDWLQSLSLQNQNKLKNNLEQNYTFEFTEKLNKKPCEFLIINENNHEVCSIYEARPIICRTQGIPVEIEETIDACPLNFAGEIGKSLNKSNFDSRSILNLERLNMLSSFSQKEFQKNSKYFEEEVERIKLKDLKKIILDSFKDSFEVLEDE